ncbi:Anoctamin-6, partial [Parelaphostrongylus tenuis]
MDRDPVNSIPLLQQASNLVEMTGCAGTILRGGNGTAQEVEEKKYDRQVQDLKDFFALEWDKSCYFSDGKRQIDYVLAYEEDIEIDLVSENSLTDSDGDEDEDKRQNPATVAERRRLRRLNFETNLQKMVLEKQAQILSVKLPVQQSDVHFQNRTSLPGVLDNILSRVGIFDFDERTRKALEEPDFFTAPYSSDRRNQFVNWDRPDILFPNAERSRMVYDLLTRAHYDDVVSERNRNKGQYRFGIERLLNQGA